MMSLKYGLSDIPRDARTSFFTVSFQKVLLVIIEDRFEGKYPLGEHIIKNCWFILDVPRGRISMNLTCSNTIT